MLAHDTTFVVPHYKDTYTNLTTSIIENMKKWCKKNNINLNLGKGIYSTDLEQSLSTELIENGIKFITVLNDSECKEVEYATEWSKYQIGTLYLTWTTCGNLKQTEKGFYQSDSSFIEIFGIGKLWKHIPPPETLSNGTRIVVDNWYYAWVRLPASDGK